MCHGDTYWKITGHASLGIDIFIEMNIRNDVGHAYNPNDVKSVFSHFYDYFVNCYLFFSHLDSSSSI